MNFKITFLVLVCLFLSRLSSAQRNQPFNSIGKKGEILTLSHGKYDEFFEKDSLERVGTVLINRITRKIEKLLNQESLYFTASESIQQSKFLSVDPLTSKYAELTPYQYASNSPISGTDLDGKEFKYYGLDWKDKSQTKLKVGQLVRTDDDIILKLVFRVGNVDGGHLVEIPVTLDRGTVGLTGNFVNYNGKTVQIPDNLTNNLPPQNNDIWNSFKTADEIDDNFIGAVNLIVSTVQNLDALLGIIKKGQFSKYLQENRITERVANIKSLRQKAVRDAWKQERELVEKTGRGTREWTKKEIAELKETGKVKGYEGHHINSVSNSPELAGEANNIEFVKGRKEHLDKHDGNFRNPTSGELIDRKSLLERSNN